MTIVRPDDYWVANIPFTDGSGSKKRPVLVLWLDAADVVAAAITSASPRSATDVLLNDWKVSGLRLPSTVRLSRLDCLEQSLLFSRIGKVSSGDGQMVKQVWASHVRPDV